MSMVLTDPPSPTTHPPAESTRRRGRWEVWRSPSDQPPWTRPLLLIIAAVAAALFAWNIASAGLSPFYSVAVKSMSESWKAFFYGAFDPKATITIDKLAGSFLPQALSARVFGFHPWSLALPQVIEGVIAVLVMYRMVRRWAGAVPGLLAASLFALTPIVASVFGHGMEDGALNLCLVLAADAWPRAVTEQRLRSLLWAGFWVGVGFQCKMLQAWMVLPALILGYLFCASGSVGRRVRDLALFGVVTLGTSLSWILLYTFTPSGDRPYVDGSTNNSAWSMVFGYNGLERFGISVPGSVTSGPGVTAGGGRMAGAIGSRLGHGGFGRGGFGGGGGGFGTGWTKLLGSEFGPQIAWLFPLTLLALACGLLWTRRARRDDKIRAGFVMWGLWALTFGLVFSDMRTIPHTAYVTSLAPALAALSAAGIVMFWRAYRAGGRRGWMLPIAVALSLAWAVFLWRSYLGFLPWTLWVAVAAGLASVAVMIWARVSRRTALRVATAGLAVGVAAMLAPASSWAASVLDAKYAGSSLNAGAGPDSGMGGGHGMSAGNRAALAKRFGAGGGFSAGGAPGGGFGGAPSGAPGGFGRVPGGATGGGFGRAAGGAPGGGFGGMMGATESMTSAERQIYGYVTAHRDGASYLMAVGSWSQAAPYIDSAGQEVMPMGGFSGSVPEPTLAQARRLVSSGQLRFFLLNNANSAGGFGGFMGRGSSPAVKSIESWVEKTCAAVPPRDYGGTSAAGQTLYECQR